MTLFFVLTFHITQPYVSMRKMFESNNDSDSFGETHPFVQSILLMLNIAFLALKILSCFTFLNSEFCENSTPEYLKDRT